MRPMLLLLLCVLQLSANAQALPAWVSPQGLDDPHIGQVLDAATGRWLPPDMLVESLVAAPHVLVGEKHDNPDHHRLQLWLLQQLQQKRAQGALLMEMIGPDQQAAVDRLQGGLPYAEGALESELDWSPGWDWELYGPLARWGLANTERLLAANLDEQEMRDIYRQPPAPAEGYSAEALELLNRSIAEAHCGKLPETQLPAMLAIQQARDQHMTAQLLAAPAPALLLAGNYHVRKDLGVPVHWPEDGTPPPVVVMLVEAGSVLPDSTQADFVWLTAALAETDYCAQWAQD